MKENVRNLLVLIVLNANCACQYEQKLKVWINNPNNCNFTEHHLRLT